MENLVNFSDGQLKTVERATAMAEDLVSEIYKVSATQWARTPFDVKTLAQLSEHEVTSGHFAQLFRYQGQRPSSTLSSGVFDFYKICLQDHEILKAVGSRSGLRLFPLALYILCHELTHVVRFARFIQSFDASERERNEEEARVHAITREILAPVGIPGMETVCRRYEKAGALEKNHVWAGSAAPSRKPERKAVSDRDGGLTQGGSVL
ncbi:MAG: hypothetical protein AB1921_00065 [Thermodesulfobacteriota bacterium]